MIHPSTRVRRIAALAAAVTTTGIVAAAPAVSHAAAGAITGSVAVPAGRTGEVVVELTTFVNGSRPSTTVAADGSYTIPWTGACTFVRARSTTGFLTVASTPRRVCPGETAPTLALAAAGAVTGSVTGATTSGPYRTAVSATTATGAVVASTVVNADGSYRIGGLPAGSYYVATDLWDGGQRPTGVYWAPARQAVYAPGVAESALLDRTTLAGSGAAAIAVSASVNASVPTVTTKAGGTATSTLTCLDGSKPANVGGTAWPIQYTDTPGNDLLGSRDLYSTNGAVVARGLADTDYLIQAWGCPAVAGGKWQLDVFTGNTLNPDAADTVYAPPGAPDTFAPLDLRTARLFPDVTARTTFVGEMQWAVEEGVIRDDPAKNFGPTSMMRRDLMAAYLYRLAGSPAFTPPTTSPFTDLTPSSPYYKEVTWLAKTGVTTGWPNGNGTSSYRPAVGVGRDMMAAFFYRFVGRPAWTPPATSPFTDLKPSSPFYAEVTWLATMGVTTGWTEANGTKTYRPIVTVNKDMMAAFLFRLDDGVSRRTIATGAGTRIAQAASVWSGGSGSTTPVRTRAAVADR